MRTVTVKNSVLALTSAVGIILGSTACTNEATSSLASASNHDLDLPRIPWEGGPDYWKSFAKANGAGWADPTFFPIGIWYNGISSDEEAMYDKDHGINTYMGMADTTPYSLFEDNDLFWIGGALNDSFTSESRNWVGSLLDDEVDGRFSPSDGRQHLEKLSKAVPEGNFAYANFTQMVISKYMDQTDAQAYVNDYTDAVSLDMYWYSIPYCDLKPYQNTHIVPIDEQRCRTASSYGKSVKALRQQDSADGKLQPIWQFVENLNGGPGEGPFQANIQAGELQGAVMSSIINEARGIIYFNQSLSGPCGGGSILRLSQITAGFCGTTQMDALKDVNSKIREIAPILNTQSFSYTFGDGLETMLKSRDGYAYIFSMLDGSSDPGERTLALPDSIRGRSADVLFENRSVHIGESGSFTDSFSDEYAYHIYRVAL